MPEQAQEQNKEAKPEEIRVYLRKGKPPFLLRLAPYFLSSFFFTSVLFTLFSALPLLFFFSASPRKVRWAALFTNTAIVFLMSRVSDGNLSSLGAAGVYLALVGAPSMILMEALIERRRSVELSFLSAFLGVLLVLFVGAVGYGVWSGSHPLQQMDQWFARTVDAQVKVDPTSGADWPITPKQLKDSFLPEVLPVAPIIAAFLFVWANLVLILRMNPLGLRQRAGISDQIFTRWKAPENLVWPVLLCIGAFLLSPEGPLQIASRSLMWFFALVYGAQGLSILAFYLNHWRIWPLFRPALYLLTLFLMPYLLLITGFFDLWFDFRAKVRQS